MLLTFISRSESFQDNLAFDFLFIIITKEELRNFKVLDFLYEYVLR